MTRAGALTIPKSSRFKCERCGWLKRKPGKCVLCGKIADFDNLMGGGVESRHVNQGSEGASGITIRCGCEQPNEYDKGSGCAVKQGVATRLLPPSRISDRPAHHSNFNNLMEAAWQSAGTVTSLPGKLQTANTQKLHGQRSPVAIINFHRTSPARTGECRDWPESLWKTGRTGVIIRT